MNQGCAHVRRGITQTEDEGVVDIKACLTGQAAQWLLERPGRERSLSEWAGVLENAGREIEARAAVATRQQMSATALRHVTGIEAWGQSRLRVFLGAPLHMDEYDAYAPAADLDLPTLRAAFAATRDATVALAEQLSQAGVSETKTVNHNTFGPLTARGWLAYLNSHANRETWFVK